MPGLREQAVLDSGIFWCLQVALERTMELETKCSNAAQALFMANALTCSTLIAWNVRAETSLALC